MRTVLFLGDFTHIGIVFS